MGSYVSPGSEGQSFESNFFEYHYELLSLLLGKLENISRSS